LCDEGLVLGQLKTDDKSNEITAIPELLRVLDIRGATVTIDAMGCQTEIARTIVDGGGHYQLQVKDNQPTLLADVKSTFAEADDPRRRSVDEAPRPQVEVFEQVEKGHGRLEERRVELCRDLAWMTTAERWASLNYVLRVTRTRTDLRTGKTSTETSYGIGSNPAFDAPRAARTTRDHWLIECSLHWVLDMAFNEDQARHRAKNLAQNFTTLRHFALNLIKGDKGRKLGVANTRKRAGWDHAYLLQILTSETG
jgi:predicted transposase YbfD/YdcC